MNDVAWTDLTPAEQRAIAVLGSGMSVEICDGAALRTLRRDGLVRGSRLTELGEQLRQAAILQTLVN